MGGGIADVSEQLLGEVAEGVGVVRVVLGSDHDAGPPWSGEHDGLHHHVIPQEAPWPTCQTPQVLSVLGLVRKRAAGYARIIKGGLIVRKVPLRENTYVEIIVPDGPGEVPPELRAEPEG